MFDQVGARPDQGPVAWLQRPGVQAAGIAVGVMCLAVAGYGWTLYRSAVSEQCVAVPRQDLTMEETKDLVARRKAYQSNRSNEATLELGERQASMLLADLLSYDVWLEVDAKQVAHVKAAIPRVNGTCWNVDYSGSLRVENGQVTFQPAHLVVGSADLTALTGWTTWTIDSDDIADERLRDTLKNAEVVELQPGQVHVKQHDRNVKW